jgi:ribonuclease HI
VPYDENGAVLKELCRYLGITTNNVAEYEGLLMGLEAAIELGGKTVRIQSDSELMVRQLNGHYRVKNKRLKQLHQRALDLLHRLQTYHIIHIRREANQKADYLANQGIEQALKGTGGAGCLPRSKAQAIHR